MEMEQYFYEAFDNMERLGPGSIESTERAMEFYPKPKAPIKILDIGCGVGTHTFLLAKQFPNAKITAIDNHGPYIEQLNIAAKRNGVSERVHGMVLSMFEMPFDDESFDLIWSEGAIYIAGFEQGIKEWRRILKPNGYLICSEISWLTQNPSEEIARYWQEGYSGMDSIEHNLAKIEAAGYVPSGQFICPVTDWTTNYYDFIQKNLDTMRKKYTDNEVAMEVVGMLQTEIDIYKKYKDEYSYVFYSMKRE